MVHGYDLRASGRPTDAALLQLAELLDEEFTTDIVHRWSVREGNNENLS